MQLQRPLAVITPTLDGDVLTMLAHADAAFTPGQVARLLPDASVEGIRKVLQRLAGTGVVTAARVGNAYVYRLNREHLAAASIVDLAAQRATLLSRLEDSLAAWPVRPVHGALFGSAARGEMRIDSDIDLFLVHDDDVDEDAWQIQTGELADAVTRWTGNDARVVSMSETEVRDGAAAGDPLLTSIAGEGLTISGRPTWLRTVIRSGRTT